MLELDQGGRGAARAARFSTPPDLQGIVEDTWLQPGPVEEGWYTGRSWRVVADPSPHIIVKRFSSGRIDVRVVGPRTRWVDVDPRREFTVAIRLRPGLLPALIGVPATELLDRSEDLGTVLGRGPVEPVEEAAARGSGRAVVDALQELLRKQMGDAMPDWRVRGLLRLEGDGGVGEIARAMGVSGRTLRERVGAAAGMPPAQILRIRRLHRALLAGLRGSVRSWSEGAHRAGFHDQSHFIRDCRSLLGETPSTFAARRH